MTRRKAAPSFDWGAWVRSFGVWVLGFVGVLVAFYFTTKFTLDKHEQQFAEVGRQFERFNQTLQKNYSDWANATKLEQEKSEKNAKEEREVRERMREQFMALFTQLSTSSAGTNAEVKAITKSLDNVTTKIDSIQNVQQQRLMQQNTTGAGRR